MTAAAHSDALVFFGATGDLAYKQIHDHSSSTEHFRFRVGPEVTVLAIGMRVKRPGEPMVGREVELVASEGLAHDMLPYERLLGDAMLGDANLFARLDAIEAQWRIVEPALDIRTPPFTYEPGTWGPAEADRLAQAAGGWHRPIDPRRPP